MKKAHSPEDSSPRPLWERQGESLPIEFINLMRQHLGDEQAEALFQGLNEPPTISMRLNPRKSAHLTPSPTLNDPVPWCPDAYYLDGHRAFTFDPLFHAGAYYVQDASSMYLAEILRKYTGETEGWGGKTHPTTGETEGAILDLCAAPGGKSTLLASLMPDGCTLISNEPIHRRAQILAENMQKWGHPHCLVTQNYPEHFTHLTNTFNLILTDVPCSGEGMFRKDPVAIQEWSLDNVHQCVERQRNILTAILPTLRPGGLLIYSTCTFNRYEDEEQVEWLVQEHGMELLEQRHFFPGRDRGEGLFMAALRNPESEEGAEPLKSIKSLKSLKTLNIIANVDEYIQQLENADSQLELTYDQAISYLRREALHIAAPRGIIAVTYRGLPLGLAKSVGNRLNNLYPQEWRIRTTYNPTEPLPDLFCQEDFEM